MSNIPKKVIKAADKAADALDKLTARHLDRLEAMLQAIQEQMIDLAARISVEHGIILGPQWTMEQLAAIQIDLANTIKAEYRPPIKKNIREFSKAEKIAQRYLTAAGISSTFTRVDKDWLKSLKKQTFVEFSQLGYRAESRLVQAVYEASGAGWTPARLRTEIMGIVSGHKDVKGKPLASYVKAYAQDAVMNHYATVHKIKSDVDKVGSFIYSGTVIATTRPFCQSRAGKVYTRKEIEALNNQTWAGKAPGDVFIRRGGYGCRHHWNPVLISN